MLPDNGGWTAAGAADHGKNIPTLLFSGHSPALLTNPELKIREFHGPDESWLNFVVESRKGIKHDFDLVFGPVANDKVFTVVNLYESGVLDAPAAIAELKAYKTYNQLSFHTPRVITALKFIGSYEVKE